jgi:GTPase SAR1 family protein
MVVGLDGSGKSTLCSHVNPYSNSKNRKIIPTIGYDIKRFIYKQRKIAIYDMSGDKIYQDL